ncbi:MAG: DUF4190 domain-containing protein [Actinomycetota bacterium]
MMSDHSDGSDGGPPRPDLAPTGEGLPSAPLSGGTPAGSGPTYPPKTDGFAIAALVLGILGGILGLVFGLIALRRIRRRGTGGRGLAIAGIVLSSIWIVLIGLGVIVAIFGSAERSPTGEVVAAGDVTFDDLRVGDCLTDLPSGTSLTVPVGPCSDPHDGEVYDVTALRAGPWPGDDEVVRLSEGACQKALPAYVSADPGSTGYDIFYFHPLEESWSADRNVICIATDPSGSPLVGSIRGRGPLQS